MGSQANSALDSDADASSLALDNTAANAVDIKDDGDTQGSEKGTATPLNTTSQRWQLLAGVALTGWLITAVLLLLSRRRERQWRIHTASEPDRVMRAGFGAAQKIASLTELELITREGDLPAIARATLSWAARQWPHAPPMSLNALALLLADTAAADPLQALDAALYRGGTKVKATGVEDAIAVYGSLPQKLREAVAKHPDKATKSDKRRHLPALHTPQPSV
jgi:hypothetical protein